MIIKITNKIIKEVNKLEIIKWWVKERKRDLINISEYKNISINKMDNNPIMYALNANINQISIINHWRENNKLFENNKILKIINQIFKIINQLFKIMNQINRSYNY